MFSKTKCFFYFVFEEEMPLGKLTFFCIHLSQKKEAKCNKKNDRALFKTPKQMSMRKFGAVLAMFDLSQSFLHPISTEP